MLLEDLGLHPEIHSGEEVNFIMTTSVLLPEVYNVLSKLFLC